MVRDYLDVAALFDRYGIAHSADVLGHIDQYYADQRGPAAEGVATQRAAPRFEKISIRSGASACNRLSKGTPRTTAYSQPESAAAQPD